MWEIKLMNVKGETFIKKYTSEYFMNKDIQKYRRSKKLKILSIIRY